MVIYLKLLPVRSALATTSSSFFLEFSKNSIVSIIKFSLNFIFSQLNSYFEFFLKSHGNANSVCQRPSLLVLANSSSSINFFEYLLKANA